MSDIKKTVNTVRYMTFRQWKYRAYYTIRNKVVKRHLCTPQEIIDIQPLSLNYKNNLKKQEAINDANMILNNSFVTVSGIVKSFENEIDWDLKDETYRLICFRLNSFRYLLDLSDAFKITDNKAYIDKGFELIENWWKGNSSLIRGNKWNPYVIAERLMNWIGFCSEYCDPASRDISKYASWIYQQSIELKKSVEYQLGANHLLSEGKALLVSGAFLKNKNLYKYGKKLLQDEYKEQFLSDGGHYERSVSYHIESLQQYFESIAVMTTVRDNELINFIRMIKPAYQYLYGMVAVNGEFPLFNDSARDYPFENAVEFLSTGGLIYCTSPPKIQPCYYYYRWNWIDVIKEPIEWKKQSYFSETGYIHQKINVGNENYSLFFDVGNGGPDSNLGHAHADALSILLTSSHGEILVDSGVFTYKSGSERNECRSTKAHNTVEVEETNSSEVWSAFRVARRSHSKVVNYNSRNGMLSVRAIHDGYCKCLKSPVIHERIVQVNNGVIEVLDKLIGISKFTAVSRFHFDEGCSIEMTGDKECLINEKILVKCSLPIRVVDCEISKYFGIKMNSKCLEIPHIDNKKQEIKTIFYLDTEEKKND